MRLGGVRCYERPRGRTSGLLPAFAPSAWSLAPYRYAAHSAYPWSGPLPYDMDITLRAVTAEPALPKLPVHTLPFPGWVSLPTVP